MTMNDMQEEIRMLWMEMLQVEHILPDQTFFELGGDSLQMVDMLFQLGTRLETEIDPGLLFENPSLAAFSASLMPSRGP